MRTVLHLLPDLGPHGHAQQVALIAPRPPRDRFRVQVAAFRDDDFFRAPLYAADIPVFVLGPHRPFPPVLWLALRRLLAQQRPDLIHAWGWPALRLAATATLGRRLPIIAGDTAVTPRTGWFDRWCLRRAARIVLPAGQTNERTTIMPYCVEATPPVDRAAARRKLDLPPEAPVFLFAGALAPGHGWREALQVFDILSHVYADTWLLMAGDGPDAAACAEFTAKLGLERVRRLGWRRDVPDLIVAVDAVFIFGECGGRNVALQALAADTPVAGWRRPDLQELLGGAAVFAQRDDRQGIATALRRLIEDKTWREEVVGRGRSRAAQFAPEVIVTLWESIYAHV